MSKSTFISPIFSGNGILFLFSCKSIHERIPYCAICILKAFCTKNTERKPVSQHFRYAFKQSLWSNNYHFCCSIKAFYRESSGHPSKFEHPSFFCNIITRLAVLCDWCLLRWERRKIYFFLIRYLSFNELCTLIWC